MFYNFFIYSTLGLLMLLFSSTQTRVAVPDVKPKLIFPVGIWCSIILFAFVFGCRYDVGIDYLTYLTFYENTNTNSAKFVIHKKFSDIDTYIIRNIGAIHNSLCEKMYKREVALDKSLLSVKFGIIIDKNFSWKSKLLVLTACINRELTTQILTYLRNKNYIKL